MLRCGCTGCCKCAFAGVQVRICRPAECAFAGAPWGSRSGAKMASLSDANLAPDLEPQSAHFCMPGASQNGTHSGRHFGSRLQCKSAHLHAALSPPPGVRTVRTSVTQEVRTAEDDSVSGECTLLVAHSVHLQSQGDAHCRSRSRLWGMRTANHDPVLGECALQIMILLGGNAHCRWPHSVHLLSEANAHISLFTLRTPRMRVGHFHDLQPQESAHSVERADAHQGRRGERSEPPPTLTPGECALFAWSYHGPPALAARRECTLQKTISSNMSAHDPFFPMCTRRMQMHIFAIACRGGYYFH